MGAVSMTCLIMLAMTAVSVSSRFTSHKGNEIATYIQNRDSHYKFLETQTDERCSEMSKATALVGACKDIPWLQVACTVALSAPAIIGSYEDTKNHLIDHLLANTTVGRSGGSIG